MKHAFVIDAELTDKITAQNLLDSYYMLNDSISNFYLKYEDVDDDDIPSHEIINLQHDMKYRDGIEIALQYYLTAEQYKLHVLEEDAFDLKKDLD